MTPSDLEPQLRRLANLSDEQLRSGACLVREGLALRKHAWKIRAELAGLGIPDQADDLLIEAVQQEARPSRETSLFLSFTSIAYAVISVFFVLVALGVLAGAIAAGNQWSGNAKPAYLACFWISLSLAAATGLGLLTVWLLGKAMVHAIVVAGRVRFGSHLRGLGLERPVCWSTAGVEAMIRMSTLDVLQGRIRGIGSRLAKLGVSPIVKAGIILTAFVQVPGSYFAQKSQASTLWSLLTAVNCVALSWLTVSTLSGAIRFEPSPELWAISIGLMLFVGHWAAYRSSRSVMQLLP